MVAGVGFEPHDLQVMSLTSYRAALSRHIRVAGDISPARGWTQVSRPAQMFI